MSRNITNEKKSNSTNEETIYFLSSTNGDKLVVPAKRDIAKINRGYLSPSSAAALSDCHAKFALSKLFYIPQKLTAPAPIGNAAHRVMELLFKEPPQERTYIRSTKLLEKVKAEYKKDFEREGYTDKDIDAWKALVRKAYTGIFDLLDVANIDVESTELKLNSVPIGPKDVPVTGFIDLLLKDKDGFIVDDYKTGQYKAENARGCHYDDQLRIYTAALRSLGKTVKSANLLFTAHKRSRPVKLDDTRMTKTLNNFTSKWDLLNSVCEEGVFECETSVLCSFCPFVKLCPAAQKDSSVMKYQWKGRKDGLNIGNSDGDVTGSALNKSDLEIEIKYTSKKDTSDADTFKIYPKDAQTDALKELLNSIVPTAKNGTEAPVAKDALTTQADTPKPTKPATAPTEPIKTQAEQTVEKKSETPFISFMEMKPYDIGLSVTGQINMANYGVARMFEIKNLAQTCLFERDASYYEKQVRWLSQAIIEICTLAAGECFGVSYPQTKRELIGLFDKSSMRETLYALRSVLTQRPIPKKDTFKLWDEWRKDVYARTIASLRIAIDLIVKPRDGSIDLICDAAKEKKATAKKKTTAKTKEKTE
jgi:hypothetical protein